MAIATAAAAIGTGIEVVNQIDSLLGNHSGMLIRLRNETKAQNLTFGAARDFDDIEMSTVPAPHIPPGNVSDAAFSASNVWEAGVTVEYRGHTDEVDFQLVLYYKWVSKFDADYTVEVATRKRGGSDEFKAVATIKGDEYRTATLHWDAFDVQVLSSGKTTEIVVLEKGIL